MKNKISLILAFLAGIFLLNSCLNDDLGEYWKDDLAGKMYATVPKSTLQTMALKPVAGEVQFEFLLNIATDALPTEDITITLVVDQAAVTQYNKDFSKSYKIFPTIDVVTKTVTIAKGTRNAYAKAKVWGAEVLNACDNFCGAISIQSAKTASGKDIPIAANMKSYVLALPISNPYAGDYKCVGYRLHPTLGVFPVDKIQTASTVDCKTIIKNGFGDYPYDMKIEITSTIIKVGTVDCLKCNVTVLDPATNDLVAGSQQYTTFTGDANTVPKPVTKDVNYYNPVTKTFVLNAAYNAAAPRIAYEVLTRQ